VNFKTSLSGLSTESSMMNRKFETIDQTSFIPKERFRWKIDAPNPAKVYKQKRSRLELPEIPLNFPP
jgi:hypothetical protein